METYQYKAFISYRHTEPDASIAKKLHTMIENYAIPGNIQKTLGIRKMGRVFRDQEELPLSQDLGADIHKALENSEWLIAICSPRYLESKWCNAELDYFISIGKGDHILAILVDGSPADSFPQQLRYQEYNGTKVELEPLAADVRAADLAGSLKKLKTEKLRLLAPMLNVNFDDLRQRARKRKARITAAVLGAAFSLLAGFLVYAVIKNGQITRERNTAVDNQMKLLIEQANISSAEGNKMFAMTKLLDAEQLRATVGEGNDPAYKAALEYALYNKDFAEVLRMDNDNRQFDSLVFSHNDKYLLGITNLNSACLMDAVTGKILYTVSRSDIGMLDSIGFTKDDKYFYMVDSWYNFVSVYNTETGELYRQYDASDGMAWNIGDTVFPMNDHKILIMKEKVLVLWDYETGEEKEILPCGDLPFESYTRPVIVDLSPDEQSVVIGSHGYEAGMKILRLDGSAEIPLEYDHSRGYPQVQYSGDGNFIASRSGNRYYVFDAKTGKNLLEGVSEKQETGIESVLINYDGSVLLTMSSTVLEAIDVRTGEILWQKTAESNVVTEAYLSPNGKYVCSSGGIAGIFDIKTGDVLYEGGGTLFSNDSTKVIVNTYNNEPSLITTPDGATVRVQDNFTETLYETPRFTEPEKMISIDLKHFCSEIYSQPPGNANRKAGAYTSPDTKYAAYTHYDGFIEIYDIENRDEVKEIYCLAEHCYSAVTDLIFHENLMASCGGFDPRCVLFDVKTGQITHVLPGKEYCHGCEFSKDGTKIILLCGYSRDIAYVYSAETGNLLYALESGDSPIYQIGFNEEGTKVAAVREDGKAIIGILYPTIDELVKEAKEQTGL